MRFYFPQPIKSIAHRGYSCKYKENSYKAFKKAFHYTRKYDMIEFDLQVCKSGELVIFSKPIIKNDIISNISLSNILKHDKSILTFKNFIDLFPYSEKELYINLIGSEKTSYHFYAFIKTWNINYSKFIIFSRNINQLNFIKEKLPDIKKGLITNNNPIPLTLHFIKNNINVVSLPYDIVTHEIINKLHELKIKIFVYTINDYKEAQYIRNFDIDGVITKHKISRCILFGR